MDFLFGGFITSNIVPGGQATDIPNPAPCPSIITGSTLGMELGPGTPPQSTLELTLTFTPDKASLLFVICQSLLYNPLPDGSVQHSLKRISKDIVI